MYVYIHTNIHTYIPTYLPTYIHTYIYIYIYMYEIIFVQFYMHLFDIADFSRSRFSHGFPTATRTGMSWWFSVVEKAGAAMGATLVYMLQDTYSLWQIWVLNVYIYIHSSTYIYIYIYI